MRIHRRTVDREVKNSLASLIRGCRDVEIPHSHGLAQRKSKRTWRRFWSSRREQHKSDDTESDRYGKKDKASPIVLARLHLPAHDRASYSEPPGRLLLMALPPECGLGSPIEPGQPQMLQSHPTREVLIRPRPIHVASESAPFFVPISRQSGRSGATRLGLRFGTRRSSESLNLSLHSAQ